MNERCSNCRKAVEKAEGPDYLCCAGPGTPILVGVMIQTHFPPMQAHGWCAAHEHGGPRKEALA